MSKLNKAFQLFDEYNKKDPHTLIWEGTEFPTEYFYALQLYKWVTKLSANASEALILASRCQHIGRWKVPRNEYPAGKAGYLRWRADLAKFHSKKQLTKIAEVSQGIDGIEPVGNGDFVLTAWGGYIWYVYADGRVETLLETHQQKKNTADIGYDAQKRIVYVPTFNAKTVVAYSLK